MNQHLSALTCQVTLGDLLRLQAATTMLDRWQATGTSRLLTAVFLQQPDVEDIMKVCSCWQLQLVGDSTHTCQNFEWVEEMWPQLAAALAR
jgi:hypothetical protein